MMGFWKHLAFGVSVAAILSPSAAIAQDAAYQFNIPSQELGAALRAYGQQSGQQLGFDAAITRDKQSSALMGGYSAEEGLRRLLEGTGLNFERSPAGVLIIQDPSSPTRLGAANESTPSEAYSEILVIGRRTLNADIRRTEDDAQPYVVFNRADIERSGARSLEDFLRQNATASASYVAPNQDPTSIFGATSEFDLRGLGSDETLVLVDGRRVAGFTHPNVGNSRQPDLNGIPLGAIERIEVLPTTASGIYGGGATGGVVNIVLRRDYTGGEIGLTYANTFDTDVGSRVVDFSAGYNLEDGRTNIIVAGSHSESNELLVGDRDLRQRARANTFENNPSSILGASSPPLGATTNIRSSTGAMLTLKPAFGGGELGSNITHVPYLYDGPGADSGAGLIANAGAYNLDFSNTAQSSGGNRASLFNAPTISSFGVTVRREFTPYLDGFIDAGWSRNESRSMTNPSAGTFSLTAADTANPFNQAITVTTPIFGGDLEQTTELETVRAAAGAIFDLPYEWRGEADYAWSQTNFAYRQPGAINPTTARVSVADGSIDVFSDTNANSVNFAAFLLPYSYNSDAETTLQDVALRLSGPIPIRLPGGEVSLSFLAEHRETELAPFYTYSVSPFFPTNPTPYAFVDTQSQQVDSVYLEARLPIVSDENDVPFVHLLELQIAARHDAYETIASNRQLASSNAGPATPFTFRHNELESTDPTVGLRYAPVEDITFRASYGTGFLPPDISQLVPNPPSTISAFFSSLLGLRDPLRNNELLGNFTNTSLGNPNLDPEQSESVSIGFIAEPRFLPNLRFSADWTRIEKEDAITTLNSLSPVGVAQLILFAPERITRGPNLPGDPPGIPGPITAIDATMINIARADIEALDLALQYDWETQDWGNFSFEARATHVLRYESQVVESAPLVDNLDIPANGGPLDWRGSARLIWELGDLTAGVTTTWYDSYKLPNVSFVILNQGSDTIPSQSYTDVFVSYELNTPWSGGSGTQLQAGVNNVFDEEPPIDFGSYSNFGDPRLANFYISLRQAF
jgi:iron complex outermembrane recepter protein